MPKCKPIVLSVIIVCGIMLMPVASFAQVGKNQGVLNPNTADPAELAAVPGIDDALAARIVAARPLSGASSLDGLLGSGMDAGVKASIYGKLFLPINLNTASEEEIMMIPGMSGKLAHEFEEYRPYTSLDQFRREMGKYIDEAEIARIEQYVFAPMDLNAASGEDFATIPGISEKMIHEFEEYRPYESMEQFRREMGKYVDEGEVARLERYVEIR